MCSNCNQSNSRCNSCEERSCGGYFSQGVNPCLSCDPVYIETQCGHTKLVAGNNIRLVAGIDQSSNCRTLTISTITPVTTGIPASTEGVDGEIRVDAIASRLYVRVAGVWKYTALI
jgi:hypothetical protein